MRRYLGKGFSTFDVDNDEKPFSCAVRFHGAWWFRNCHVSHLNGAYSASSQVLWGNGIMWHAWKGEYYSLKAAEMKIRPAATP